MAVDQKLNIELGKQGVMVTTIQELYNWGRRSSIWPMQFGLACCAIEMIATTMARYDLARFGSEVFRPSPRQADLMIISGTVTKKMAPQVVRLYNQMAEPRYVIAMDDATCARHSDQSLWCLKSFPELQAYVAQHYEREAHAYAHDIWRRVR